MVNAFNYYTCFENKCSSASLAPVHNPEKVRTSVLPHLKTLSLEPEPTEPTKKSRGTQSARASALRDAKIPRKSKTESSSKNRTTKAVTAHGRRHGGHESIKRRLKASTVHVCINSLLHVLIYGILTVVSKRPKSHANWKEARTP